MTENGGRTIDVGYLARVEGEGSLRLEIRDGVVEEVRLSIFEAPRFFEALLKGRRAFEAPDITARICGICPVAYQMSAVHAIEHAAGVTVDGPLRALRRLLYCGEWIASHTLHIYLLHAPDFLGYENAIDMGHDDPALIARGLELKKIGNHIMSLLGGREVHPINVRVGGFYSVPTRAQLAALVDPLERARDMALDTVRWAAALPFPDYAQPYEFVALRHGGEYPMNGGRIVSSAGLDIAAQDFDDHFEERQVPHSTALHAVVKGRGGYFVGPMARYALNADLLTPLARRAAADAGLDPTCTNPFKSIVVRGIEVLLACEEALRLIADYAEPDAPYVPVEPRAAVGQAATEAPRGLLHHRYAIDADGRIEHARIVPPTSQNQMTIEADLKGVAAAHLDLDDEALKWRCEQTIRNYDPCISCATHFLRLEVDRR